MKSSELLCLEVGGLANGEISKCGSFFFGTSGNKENSEEVIGKVKVGKRGNTFEEEARCVEAVSKGSTVESQGSTGGAGDEGEEHILVKVVESRG